MWARGKQYLKWGLGKTEGNVIQFERMSKGGGLSVLFTIMVEGRRLGGKVAVQRATYQRGEKKPLSSRRKGGTGAIRRQWARNGCPERKKTAPCGVTVNTVIISKRRRYVEVRFTEGRSKNAVHYPPKRS